MADRSKSAYMRIRRGAYAVVSCWFARCRRICQNVRWVWQFTRPKLSIFEDAGRIAIGLRHVGVLSSFSFFYQAVVGAALRCVRGTRGSLTIFFRSIPRWDPCVFLSVSLFLSSRTIPSHTDFIALLASKSIPKRRPWQAGDQNHYSIYGLTCDICGEWEIELTHCLARDDLYYNALLWILRMVWLRTIWKNWRFIHWAVLKNWTG